VKKEFASGSPFAATFDLGQVIYAIIGEIGEQATKGTPDEIQWKLFGLIGPDAIYCTEAALWLDGTVAGQIGTALRKKFLTFSVGQQLLASRPSAISGRWVLHRRLVLCASGQTCSLNVMKARISCSGAGCTFIRTNASDGGEPPWDHAIPLAFSNGAWRASGTERNAAECHDQTIPGTGVALTLTVTNGGLRHGVWRAQQLAGRYTIVVPPTTTCFPQKATSREKVSTQPF
jgi:hypothetical protein